LEQATAYASQERYEQAEASYKAIIEAWPGSDAALASQEGLCILYLDWGSTPKADLEYQKLVNDFAEHSELAVAVDQVADKYRAVKQYKKARAIYEYELLHWPDSDKAIDAQKNIVLTSIRLKDQTAAQAAMEKLVANYAGHSDLAKMVEGVGEEYLELDRYDEARQWYAWVTANKPQSEHALWAQVGVAASSIALGDYEAAQAAVAKLKTDLADRSDIAKALQEAGDNYAKFGAANSAVETYRYVVEQWGASDEAMESQAKIAVVYIRAGDEPNAAAATEKLLSEHAHHANLFEEIGKAADAYSKVSKHDDAARLFEHIVQHWPGTEDAMWAQMKLVASRIRQWRLDDAEAELGNLLTGFADSDGLADAVHEIVEEYRNTGAHEEGRELFNYLLTEWAAGDEMMLELQVGVALQSIKLGELAKAESAVAKLIADYNENPKIAKALFQIGEEHFYKTNYPQTIELLELIDSNYPDHDFPAKPEMLFVLATCYKHLEQSDKALATYERSLDEYPQGKYASWCPYQIGWIYTHNKEEYDKAVEWFAKQHELYPESIYDGPALHKAQWIYVHKLEDYAKGAQVCQQYIDHHPDEIDFWVSLSNLARCYAHLGDRQKAIEVLWQAHDKAKTESRRKRCLERIAKLEKGGEK
jgi:tetratricopeptide (TPR) repeat protein